MFEFDGGILVNQDFQESFTIRDLRHRIRRDVLGYSKLNIGDLLRVEGLSDAFDVDHE